MRKLKTSFNRLTLTREEKDKTEGGILLPDQVQKRFATTMGEVLEVGHTVDVEGILGKEYDKDKGAEQLIGKTLMFGEYSGGTVDIDGHKCYIVNDDDILGVVLDDGGETGSTN